MPQTRPVKRDIYVDRNVTAVIDFYCVDEDGVIFDLTGYSTTGDAVGTILPAAGRLELSPTISDDTGGVINITLSKATTGGLVSTDGLPPDDVPNYDLLIDLSGVTHKISYGKFYIVETLTT